MEDQLEPMPDDWERALVIVAHPDDMEFGGAAAVAVWTDQGKEVAYVLVTRGEAGIDDLAPAECAAVREQEQIASAATVGVTQVEFLDHLDGVIEEGMKLRRDLVRVIRRHRPELIITLNHRDEWGPGSWNTPDHRVVGRAVLDASGDAGNRWIFPEIESPWGGVRWVAVAGSPRPSHAVDVTTGFDRGIASLAEHRRYLQALDERPAEVVARDWLGRGIEMTSPRFGGVPAVSFELIAR